MSDESLEPPEFDQETEVKRLTGPRDTLPDDPVGQVAEPDFPPALRGYDRAAVDAYVERVVRLVAELHSTRSPRAAVRQALDRVGTETSDILRRAHEMAEQVTSKANADAAELTARTRREVDELHERTRLEAERKLAEADREVRGMIAEAQVRAQDFDRDADEIWQERAKLLDDVRRIAAELLDVAARADGRYPPGEEEEAPAATAGDEPLAAGEAVDAEPGVLPGAPPEEPFDHEAVGELAEPEDGEPGIEPEEGATVEIPAADLPDGGDEPGAEGPEAGAEPEDDATAEWPAADPAEREAELPGPEHPAVPPTEPVDEWRGPRAGQPRE